MSTTPPVPADGDPAAVPSRRRLTAECQACGGDQADTPSRLWSEVALLRSSKCQVSGRRINSRGRRCAATRGASHGRHLVRMRGTARWQKERVETAPIGLIASLRTSSPRTAARRPGASQGPRLRGGPLPDAAPSRSPPASSHCQLARNYSLQQEFASKRKKLIKLRVVTALHILPSFLNKGLVGTCRAQANTGPPHGTRCRARPRPPP